MKQFFLLVFCILLLFSADAQSKIITGTLLPKKGNAIVYLPNSITGIDTISTSENDMISTNAKFFVFNKPIVQSSKTGTTYQSQDYQSQFSIDSSKNIATNAQFTSATNQNLPIIPVRKVYAANEPLVYEAPPTISSNRDFKVFKSLQPLVYEAPPTISKPTNVTVAATANNKATSLQSPKFKGEYKATLNQPIIMVPVSQEDIEKSMAKPQPVVVEEVKKVVVEASKYVEDLYPPLNYTVPAKGNNLRSPIITGTYAPTKNNPLVLVPVAPNTTISTPNSTEINITQQYGNNNQSIFNEPQQPSVTILQPRTEKLAAASIFDDNTNSAYKQSPGYIPAKSQSVMVATESIFDDNTNSANKKSPAYTSSKPQSAKTYNNKFQKPIKQSYNTQDQAPIIKKNIGINKFQMPVKQSSNPQQNNASSVTVKPVEDNNIFSDNSQQQVIADNNSSNDYKFYVDPNGKYNIVFYGNGSSVTVTSFGRVIDYTLPSSSSVAKPTNNYKGLIESVGNLPLQYTYEGRVASVGSSNISYNYDGAVDKVGNTPIYYNYNGSIDKIGNSKVSYNEKGTINSMDKNPMILVKQ
jgi:hypothetical protein